VATGVRKGELKRIADSLDSNQLSFEAQKVLGNAALR
jgi:hypothetical protein